MKRISEAFKSEVILILQTSPKAIVFFRVHPEIDAGTKNPQNPENPAQDSFLN
jgi:hypothetical protein